MSEEATLDAFANEGEASDDDGDGAPVSDDGDDAPVGGDGDAGRVDDSDDSLTGDDGGVAPVPVTSSWSGADGTCSACGETAGRLWADGGERVCTACMPWTRTGEDACDQ